MSITPLSRVAMSSEQPVARTVQGFCAAYGVSRATAYRLIAAGKLKTSKVFNRTLVIEESARKLVGLPAQPPVQPPAEIENLGDRERQREKLPYHKSRARKELATSRDNGRQ